MGDLFPWLSDHTIRVLTMLGSWVAPPVTILGAFWLARRSEKLQLQVEVDRVYRMGIGHKSEHIRFSITNIGHRKIKIQSITWVTFPRWRRRYYFQKTGGILPLGLAPGEDGDIAVPWDSTMASQMGFPKSVKAVIHTPIGKKRVRVGQTIRAYFREQHFAKKDEPPPSDPPSDVEGDPPGNPAA